MSDAARPGLCLAFGSQPDKNEQPCGAAMRDPRTCLAARTARTGVEIRLDHGQDDGGGEQAAEPVAQDLLGTESEWTP